MGWILDIQLILIFPTFQSAKLFCVLLISCEEENLGFFMLEVKTTLGVIDSFIIICDHKIYY